MPIRYLALSLLILILLLRIQQVGINTPEPDPFLDGIASKFESQRDYLSKLTQAVLPNPQAALMVGMVLGLKQDLSSEFRQALKNTSTLHIVVVSGQNLTLLAGFLVGLASLFGRKKTILITLIFLIFYSIFTGLQIPVLRACIMVILASIAQILGREGDSAWILALTGLSMLIYQPSWLLSISFQLSFLATVGVVIIAPEFAKAANFLPNLLKQDLTSTTAAQLMVMPIIASNFHQLSLLAVLVNGLVLWTVPLIMVTGIFTIFISLLNIWLGEIAALIPGVLLTYFVYIVEALNQPWANFYIGNISWLVWIGYYILLLGLYFFLKRKNRDNFIP